MTRRHTRTSAEEPMIAVIYCRASSDKEKNVDKRKERSVGEQEQDSREVCEDEDWTVAKVFIDNNRPASEGSRVRPEWEELIAYCETHTVHVIVVWETTRITRDNLIGEEFIRYARRKNILIHVVDDGHTYDMQNARDRKTLREAFIDGVYENDKKKARTNRAIKYGLQDGTPNGVTPFGYKRRYHEETRRFDSQTRYNENGEADAVVEAYTRFDSGWSCSAIAADWNKRGFRTSEDREWSSRAITQLLKKPAYIGMREYISVEDRNRGIKKGQLIKGQWDAISDDPDFPNLWKRVNRKLSNPTRNSNRHGSYEVAHVLSGIARCGKCLNVLTTSNRNNRMSYRCKTNGCVVISCEDLDSFVLPQIPDRLITIRFPNQDDEIVRRSLAEADEMEAELAELRERAALPYGHPSRVTRLFLADAEKDYAPQIASRRKIALSASVPGYVAKLKMEPEKWHDANMAEKRNMLRSGYLVDGIFVMPKPAAYIKVPTESRVDIQWTEERLMREVSLAASQDG